MNAAARLLLAAAALALAGCDTMYPTVQFEQPTGAEQPPVANTAVEMPHSGAIFQTSQYRPLFEDHRARQPGDTLQVTIVEKISATAKSTSALDKSSDLSGGITALPGLGSSAVNHSTITGSSKGKFAGKGSTENSNDFQGTITVTVRSVLPNGHLIVAGEKQIGVNSNVDVLRFSGQVDPRAIEPGNVVQSTRIANVRLEQRGRGAQADTNAVGWLTRVFFSVLWPL